MTGNNLKTLILSLSSNRDETMEIPQFLTRINTAILQVCKDTVPIAYASNISVGQKVLKRIDRDFFITVPEEITSLTEEITMDADLYQAVALYILASIETARSGIYMKQYWDDIAKHEYHLTRDYDMQSEHILQDFVNDRPSYIEEY
jgi:hypothetical protein